MELPELTDSQKDAVRHLEHALQLAREGQLRSVVIAAEVFPEGYTHWYSRRDDWWGMAGYLNGIAAYQTGVMYKWDK